MIHSIDNSKLYQEILSDLGSLGLSKKDGLVYLALLYLGEVGSTKISKETGLHRQFIYNSLESLQAKGLVKYAIAKGRKKWSGESPQRLIGLVREKQRVAELLTSKISSVIKLPATQKYEIYQGSSAFIDLQLNIINQASEGETIDVMSGVSKGFYEIMGKFYEQYEIIRTQKKIGIRFIGNMKQKEILRSTKDKRFLFDYRVIENLEGTISDTSIWNNGVALNFFGNPIISFAIYNKDIALGQKKFFEAIWKLGQA